MEVGDLITTYYKGYFRLTRIQRRFVTEQEKFYSAYKNMEIGEEYSPLYFFVQEFDSKGSPRKSKEKCCDAKFCSLAKDSIEKQAENFAKIAKNLQDILAQ